MKLYVRFLIFLCCTRGWYRTFKACNKTLKNTCPGDIIEATTLVSIVIPEKEAKITIKCAECGDPVTEVKK